MADLLEGVTVSDIIFVTTENRIYKIDAPQKTIEHFEGPDRGSKSIPSDGTPVPFVSVSIIGRPVAAPAGVKVENMDCLYILLPGGKAVVTSPIVAIGGAVWISGLLA